MLFVAVAVSVEINGRHYFRSSPRTPLTPPAPLPTCRRQPGPRCLRRGFTFCSAASGALWRPAAARSAPGAPRTMALLRAAGENKRDEASVEPQDHGTAWGEGHFTPPQSHRCRGLAVINRLGPRSGRLRSPPRLPTARRARHGGAGSAHPEAEVAAEHCGPVAEAELGLNEGAAGPGPRAPLSAEGPLPLAPSSLPTPPPSPRARPCLTTRSRRAGSTAPGGDSPWQVSARPGPGAAAWRRRPPPCPVPSVSLGPPALRSPVPPGASCRDRGTAWASRGPGRRPGVGGEGSPGRCRPLPPGALSAALPLRDEVRG